MNEAKFNTEVVNSIKAFGGWAYKIPDAIAGGGFARFNAKKPFDISACVCGLAFAIESKQEKKWKKFSFKDFRPHQIDALDEFVLSGGRAYAFLNVRFPGENRLIPFRWTAWRSRLEKGIPISELKGLRYVRGRKKLFDLRNILK